MNTCLTKHTRALRAGGVFSAVVGLALLAPVLPALAGKGNADNPRVMPPQSNPYGLSYADWAARYWQWTFSFPSTANPADGTAPYDSAQSGPVWFLASVNGNEPVTRDITIPPGTSLFFPVLGVYNNNAGFPNDTTFTEEELLEGVNGLWDAFASVTQCTIDGVPVNGLESPQQTVYRVENGFFPVTVADHDNLFDPDLEDGGTINTVTVGAYLMIKPLSVGKHTIRFVGAAGPVDDPFFIKDATYNITVKR